MDGHADNAPADNLAGLADFLSDTPEQESQDEETEEGSETESQEDNQPSEETESEDSDESDEDSEEASTTQDTTFKVTVKDADGADTEIEVSKDEILKGYQRQADYTRKMQSLVERESQAITVVKQKIDESREMYLREAALARAAVVNLAGLKSDQEMAQLAQTDPAQWVQEQQRQKYIQSLIGNLEGKMSAEQQRAQQESEALKAQSLQQMYQKSWEALSKEGIDKPKLVKVFENVGKSYGFTQQELSNVYDARLALMMRDAVAYRELKSKAPQVTKQTQKAPPMPSKNTPSATERKVKQNNERFRGGRAKLGDLASFLATTR